jgi:hypothetical protein
VGVVAASALVLAPVAAHAATSASSVHGVAGVSGLAPRSTGCPVSAASVSSIVGYTVPAGKYSVTHLKATPTNFETSSVDTGCIFGAEATAADILKLVSLEADVSSKPITPAEIKESIQKASNGAKISFSSYGGLSYPAYYLTFAISTFHLQEIVLIQNSTHYFGAAVESSTISKAKLGQLAELAQKI